MQIDLEDGRIVDVPDGLSGSEIHSYVAKNFGKPVTLPERIGGNLWLGAAELAGKTQNLMSLFSEVGPSIQPEMEEAWDVASRVKAQPATSFMGQLGEGLIKFIPQVPLYAAGEAAAMATLARTLPKIATSIAAPATKLLRQEEPLLSGTAKAMARGALAGATVGPITQPEGTDILGRVKAGGVEAAEFGAATGVLHPIFKVIGKASRGLRRKLGQTENDPAALEQALVDRALKGDKEAIKALDEFNSLRTTEGEWFREYGEGGKVGAPTGPQLGGPAIKDPWKDNWQLYDHFPEREYGDGPALRIGSERGELGGPKPRDTILPEREYGGGVPPRVGEGTGIELAGPGDIGKGVEKLNTLVPPAKSEVAFVINGKVIKAQGDKSHADMFRRLQSEGVVKGTEDISEAGVIEDGQYKPLYRVETKTTPPRRKKTAVDKLQDKVDALEERIDNANNADTPNDALIDRLEKERDELQDQLDAIEAGEPTIVAPAVVKAAKPPKLTATEVAILRDAGYTPKEMKAMSLEEREAAVTRATTPIEATPEEIARLDKAMAGMRGVIEKANERARERLREKGFTDEQIAEEESGGSHKLRELDEKTRERQDVSQSTIEKKEVQLSELAKVTKELEEKGIDNLTAEEVEAAYSSVLDPSDPDIVDAADAVVRAKTEGPIRSRIQAIRERQLLLEIDEKIKPSNLRGLTPRGKQVRDLKKWEEDMLGEEKLTVSKAEKKEGLTVEDIKGIPAEGKADLGVKIVPKDEAEWDNFLKSEGMPAELDFDEGMTLDSMGFQRGCEMLVDAWKKSPTIDALSQLGKAVYMQGHRTFGEFSARVEALVGDTWDSAKALVRQAWLAAKEFNRKLSRVGEVIWAKKGDKKGGDVQLGEDEFVSKPVKGPGTTLYSDPFGIQAITEGINKVLKSWNKQKGPGFETLIEIQGKDNVQIIKNKLGPDDAAPFVDYWMSTQTWAKRHPVSDRIATEAIKAELLAGHMINRMNTQYRTIIEPLDKAKQLEMTQILRRIQKGETDVTGSPEALEAARKTRELWDVYKERRQEAMRIRFKSGLNKDEYNAMQDYLGGMPIEDVIEKYQFKETITNYVTKRGTPVERKTKKKLIDPVVMRDIVKEYEAIASEGVDDYVSTYMRGNYKLIADQTIEVDGKPRKMKGVVSIGLSPEDAIRKGTAWLMEHPGVTELYIDTSFTGDLRRDIAAGVSRKQYFAIMNRLAFATKEVVDNISSGVAKSLAAKGMRGSFMIKPTDKFSPFEMSRRDILPGEDNIVPVMFAYIRATEKKLALSQVTDYARRHLAELPPNLRDATERLLDDLKGRYSMGDRMVDFVIGKFGEAKPMAYTRGIASARMLMANIKLGYRPVAAAINFASGQGHVWTKFGSEYMKKGYDFLQTGEGKQFLKEVTPYLGQQFVEGELGKVQADVEWWKPLGMFSKAETPNREMAIAAAYRYALEKMATPDGGRYSAEAAKEFAIRSNWFTQFTYNTASLPKAMRGPTGKLLTQFKPYMVKEFEFIASLRGPEIARYVGMQLALAGPRGFVYLARSLPILGLFKGWDELERYMNNEYPNASRGLVGGALGVDITAPATFQFPSRMSDWLGPAISDLVKLHEQVFKPLAEGEDVGMKAVGGWMGSTVPIFRYWHDMIEQVISGDGWVKDERGRNLYHIDNTAAFAARSIVGAQPIELNRIRTEQSIEARELKTLAANKTLVIDNVLDAIGKGEPITSDMIEKMTRYHVQPGTLRRAARFRVLDPKTRALLRAEVARRPEILENFPEQ